MAKNKRLTEGIYDFSIVTRNHVQKAIQEIDTNGVPKSARSRDYNLIYNGKVYPVKLVLSLAYNYAMGKDMGRSFRGGKGTACFNCLEGLGFEIKPKKDKAAELMFLYKKEIDYSFLKEGFTIVKELLPKFIEIYGEVPESSAKKVKIEFEGAIYNADFRHIKQSAGRSVFQIRYPANGALSGHLKESFSESSKILEILREINTDPEPHEALPANQREYVWMYYDTNKERLVFRKEDMEEKKDISRVDNFQAAVPIFIRHADEKWGFYSTPYPKEYEGLRVKASFGQFKNYSNVPWISFLYKGQITSKGIYPVLLYYKKNQLLILAYGISEEKKPDLKWDLPDNVPSISDYFASQGLGKPERYGGCYVFKAYPLSEGFAHVDFDKDLKEIISYYKSIMEGSIATPPPVTPLPSVKSVAPAEPKIKQIPFDIARLSEIRQTGLLFGEDLLRRYAVSLLTKPFVILSGLSGSGKTRLALAFARWMAQDERKQVKIVPVGADWNSREYLLGYPNGLTPGRYVRPENGVLDFVLEAAREENRGKPFFLILDEMNLSYVERYFSDFLSAMESKEAVTLHPEGAEWDEEEPDVPARLEFPENLFLIGTINVDETTYMFSPKVLDRANVIEFRISRKEMDEFLSDCAPVNPEAVNGWGAPMGEDFVRICRDKKLEYDKKKYRGKLLSFFDALKPVGAEFGYRTADEIYRFMAIAEKVKADWKPDDLMDIVVMQKMLPRLHGSRKKMQPVLEVLWKLCKAEGQGKELLIEAEKMTFGEEFRYPLSAEKVWLMYRNAQDNGFTSYAEA